MSEDKIKIVAKLPKGELDGFAAGLLAETLCTRVTEGSVPPPMAAIFLLDVKKVEVDPDTGARTAHLRIVRSQPVLTADGRKAVEEVLFNEWSTENGPVQSFEVKQITGAAFADLPRDASEIDAREAREQDAMSPADELRKHLSRVHGREDAHLLTDGEAEEQHRADHDGDEMPAALRHDREWHGWTRADIEAAEAESEDFDTTAHPSDDDPGVSATAHAYGLALDAPSLDPDDQGSNGELLLSDPESEHLDDDLPTRVI